MVPRAGDHIAPHLRLVRPLGKGGMGSVWVVHHATLETDVAVKFIAYELGELDEHMMARFKREAALSAKLKSPHVVKTFDHGTMPNGRPYIVMELLEGETLGERLAREGRLSSHDVALVVGQVAQVLSEAHSLAVVHRDIKPDNVFLLSSAYELFVKVLDFGIAKQTSMPNLVTVTDTGAIIGTPEYMSPEQLLSTNSADYRADMWALAVLAYHALTGQPPFSGETLPALSLKICGGRFTPPSKIDALLPYGLDGWFEKAFAPTPADRFNNVATLADSFRRLIAGEEDIGIAPTTAAPVAQRSSDGARRSTLQGVPTPPRDSDAPADDTAAVSSGASPHSSARPIPSGPDESGPVQRISASELVGSTLMSALGPGALASAHRGGRSGPDDSGVHVAVELASPDQSGQRQALTDAFLQGHTPTFSGASSNLSEHIRPGRRGLLVAAFGVTLLVLFGNIISFPPFLFGKVVPLRPVLPNLSGNHLRAAPAFATAAPSAILSAAPVHTSVASASAAGSVTIPNKRPPTRSQLHRPHPRTNNTAAAAASSARPTNPCDNPYIVKADGTLTIRPECLDP